MNQSSLMAISPIDGRYQKNTQELSVYFSEFALIKFRVYVEVEYFIALCELPLPPLQEFDQNHFSILRAIYEDWTMRDAEMVKEIEHEINHDVKAVEYFLKKKFEELSIGRFKEFIHFGLTSQDINNTAIPHAFRLFINNSYLPSIRELITHLKKLAADWAQIPMLARTHGQAASPTRLGKELLVFVERLEVQLQQLAAIPFSAKFGGATGNFNAHHVAYSKIDWHAFADHFVNDQLQLSRSRFTTQIEHYDNFAAHCDALKRINIILIDFNRDIWAYISMNYFKQKIKAEEVGSSAMPHKVNPIDFENAEGNLGLANALLEHFAAKLPISRLQRDLSDSTVLRNMGVPMAHTWIAIQSIRKGLHKLIVNAAIIAQDLEANWAIVAEGIQTILRREGFENPYEALKGLTRRNQGINAETIAAFITSLDIAETLKIELRNIHPSNYTGI